MEKIILQPQSQEIIFRSPEPNTYSEVFSYAPGDTREKPLGHLYLIGQVQYGEENMAYVLNLVASLAKREYYAKSLADVPDPRQALDAALKKLNGVLEDFFKNEGLKLNLGLVAVSQENIFITRLGKFKIFLARQGEIVDILNNIALFQKEHVEEKQFMNIISGKIKPGDKIFAFSPTRKTALKEKGLKVSLLNDKQEEFVSTLANFNKKRGDFPLAGLHLEIARIKAEEIPIRSAYQQSQIILASPIAETNSDEQNLPSTNPPVVKKTKKQASSETQLASALASHSPPISPDFPEESEKKEINPDDSKNQVSIKQEIASETLADPISSGSAKILLSQMSLIKRKNWLQKLGGKISEPFQLKIKTNRNLARFSRFLVVLFIIASVGAGLKFFIFNAARGQGAIIKATEEKMRLAEVEIARQNPIVARELLSASLFSLSQIQNAGQKIESLKQKANNLLDRLDLVSSQLPQLWVDLENLAAATPNSPFPLAAVKITVAPETGLGLINVNGHWQIISPDRQLLNQGQTALETDHPPYLFWNEKDLAFYNGFEQTAVFNLADQKTASWQLTEAEPALDAVAYGGNLYLLTANSILKYSDAFTGQNQTKAKQTWFSGLASEKPRALAIDSNIYVLTDQQTVIKYFRGKEEKRISLNFKFSSIGEFFAPPSSLLFYLVDFQDKKVRAFDQESGLLAATYKLEALPGLQAAGLAVQSPKATDSLNPPPPSLTLFLLATDGKVWSLDL